MEDYRLYICLRRMKKTIRILLLVLLLGGAVIAYLGYRGVVKDNLTDTSTGFHELYVKSNWDYDSLSTALYTYLHDYESFDFLARRMNLPNKVKPGYYQIGDSLGNRALIQQLRSGRTTDVKVILNGSLKRSEILPKICSSLETDSSQLIDLFSQQKFLDSLNYNSENWPCLFVANTYFFNWATSPQKIVERFMKERDKFWDANRKNKAKALDLTPNEVIILASIVDAETMMNSEMPVIAGVYLNRLQKDWPLGADPTIQYLIADKGRQRVLYSDLEIESPYNTYKNLGLPPGPILLPSTKAIDAVLNAESHEYMFFCARSDFSGYHAFAKNLAQHNQNRAAFTRELNRRGIMR